MLRRCPRTQAYILSPTRQHPKRFVKTRWLGTQPQSTTNKHEHGFPRSHDKKLRLWHKGVAAITGVVLITWVSYQTFDSRVQRNSFETFELVAKEPVSSTASIFYLRPEEHSENFKLYEEAWKQGVWNMQFKQPQLQIVRAYTPLPPHEDAQHTQNLRFLIRNDMNGEVSSYLHRLPIGANIEIRGPYLEYQISPEVEQVVFLAGGTGIAPALQVAHAMFGGEEQKKNDNSVPSPTRKLHILWSNRRREDCLGGVSDSQFLGSGKLASSWVDFLGLSTLFPMPALEVDEGFIVKELEKLKKAHPGQVTVEYFVNEEATFINEDAVRNSLSRYSGEGLSVGTPSIGEHRQIIISGPEGFISYLAGPKEWKDGREGQGSLGGILTRAITPNKQNVKVWKI